MANVQERVIQVTCRVLGLVREQVRPEHHFAGDLGAESVQAIERVASFESEFGVDMGDDAAVAVQTVQNAVETIHKVSRKKTIQIPVK